MKLTLRSLTQTGLVLTTAALLTLSVGCESQEKQKTERITAADVRRDISSEYHTTLYSAGQQKNNEAIMNNLNGRLITDDWLRLWLIDGPSHLTPYPQPY